MNIIIYCLILLTFPFTISAQGWSKIYIDTANYREIDFLGTQFYSYSANKKIIKSTNFGLSWVSESLNINTNAMVVNDGHFINTSTGIILLGRYYFTSNGGLNWVGNPNPQNGTATIGLHDVALLNSNTALTCGYELIIDNSLEGTIYKTSNLGQNWTKVGSVDFEAWSIKFADVNTGFCISSNSIAKTINGGSSWSYIGSIGGNQFRVLSNIKNDSFYIGCATGRIVKCTNSGTAYNVVQTPVTTPINDVAFIDNNIAFAVGNNGVILKTTNGGTSWFQQTSGTLANLNALAFANKDTVIAVGDSGVVLRTFTGGLTGITNGNETVQGYILEQNYPNPFNPSTRIAFSIPVRSKVSLLITDVNGKEVGRIINNTELNPGNHNYFFNGKDLPSGIYFYKLASKEFTETKKMVLLK